VQAKLLPQQRFSVSDRPSEKPSVSSLVGVPLSKSFAVTITLEFSLDTVHFLPWQSCSVPHFLPAIIDLSARAAHDVRLHVIKKLTEANKGTQHQNSVALTHNL